MSFHHFYNFVLHLFPEMFPENDGKVLGRVFDKKLSPLTTFFFVSCDAGWVSVVEAVKYWNRLTLIESHLVLARTTRKKEFKKLDCIWWCTRRQFNVLPYVTPAVIPQEINDYFAIILQSFCINCCNVCSTIRYPTVFSFSLIPFSYNIF